MEDKNKNKEKGNKQKTVTHVVDINPTVLTIILNINDLNALIKDRDCQNGPKNKIQLYIVNKKSL